MPPDGWAILVIAGAVLLANLLYVVGVFDPNPLGPDSGLSSAISRGPAPGTPTIDLSNGLVIQSFSHRAMLDWVHFHVPWWNPYEGTGAPLAADMQSAAFFPPTLLALLSGGQLPEQMLLELLSGVATFLLLRRLSVNRLVAVGAAIAFALNGSFAWFGEQGPVNPIALLPLLLLGVELAYSTSLERRRGGWWLIAVAGALSFYAGFPETAYLDALLAAAWILWRCGCLGVHRLRPFGVKVLLGALAGALLAAPLLLPAIEYLSHADLGVHGGAVGSGTVTPRGLSMLVMPYVFGPIFGYDDPAGVVFGFWRSLGGYLTTSLVLFALVGISSRRRRGLKLTLLAWVVLSIARIYGEPHPLGQVLGVLPGMSHVAFYRYSWPSLQLAVVILAALGLDDLVSAKRSRARVGVVATAAFALVLAAIVGAVPLDHRLPSGHSLYARLSAIWAVSMIAAATLAATVSRSKVRATLGALVVSVDALALFIVPQFSTPGARLDLAPVAYLERHLGVQRFFTLGPIRPDYGSYFGLAELDVDDAMLPSTFTNYVHESLDPYTDPLFFVGNNYSGRPTTAPSTEHELMANLAHFRDAGVSYVLATPGQTLPDSALQIVFRSPSAWIYRLKGEAPYFSASNSRCVVTPRGRQTVELSCPGPTLLLRRETDLNGWSATVDGRPHSVQRADMIFQVVKVPRGSHTVTFSYAPPGEIWALVAFVAGCGLLIAPTIHRRYARTSRAAPHSILEER